MSQAGPLNETANPAIPTSFVTDAGTAVPAANVLNVLGGTDITTSGAGNTVLITFTGASTVIETLTGNSGGAVSPTANNVNTIGSGSITVVGNPGTSTLTAQLTGLTNHSLLVGAGTDTITNLGVATNGQIPIGSTGADPVLATLTAGAGISITNGAGSITVASSSTVISSWIDQAVDFNASSGNGYIITGTVTATMPAGAAQGDTIAFLTNQAGLLTIQANAGQIISIGSINSSVAGTATSNTRGDSVTLVFRAATGRWRATSVVGTWTTA